MGFLGAKLYSMTSLQDGWIVKDLTENEARAIFAVLTGQQRLFARLWTESWSGWMHLDAPECKFLFKPRSNKQQPPEVSVESAPPVEITQVMPPRDSDKAAHLARRHHRFSVQIPVTVQTVSEVFKTVTMDVSEGGIRLRDPLPDKFAGYCQVVFALEGGETFVILASPVEDQKKGRVHLEFVDSDEQQWKFIEWLRSQSWARVS